MPFAMLKLMTVTVFRVRSHSGMYSPATRRTASGAGSRITAGTMNTIDVL